MSDGAAPLTVTFGAARSLPAEEATSLLGGKGASLVAMTALGLSVPAGFVLTTALTAPVLDGAWTDEVEAALGAALDELERSTGCVLGDPDHPLLVSVRSSPVVSMPGMLDTILDIGLTEAVAAALERRWSHAFVDDLRVRAASSFEASVGDAPPVDPRAQVAEAVRAVVGSWDSDRAVAYRSIAAVGAGRAPAVIVQAMVFGNADDDSAVGACFSRDPRDGSDRLAGELLIRAQGDDVASGREATGPVEEMASRWPELWDELTTACRTLEGALGGPVEVEFTIERNLLWFLQARRSMVSAPSEPPVSAGGPGSPWTVVASGVAASPGRAAGVLCLDPDRAVRWSEEGRPVVLVRRDTSPADVHGMAASVGVVTTRGGMACHAAVVARSWGLPCVVGATELAITEVGIRGNDLDVLEGAPVVVDGDLGVLLVERVPTRSERALLG